MNESPWRTLAAGAIVLATTGLLVGMLATGITDQYAASRDFIEYWAAGQQLVHHANPYDPASILHIERAAGMNDNEPQITLSPPLAICLLLPLGLLSPKTGLILWLLALIGSLLASIYIIWVLNGRPDDGYHFCGYLFAPAVACLRIGQIGIFLLLGIALFLYLTSNAALLGWGCTPAVRLEAPLVSALLHRAGSLVGVRQRVPSSGGILCNCAGQLCCNNIL